MSLVTETLLNLLRRQIDLHGVVVWYDPEQAYTGFVADLKADDFDGAAVYQYRPDRGFIWLRHDLEPHWQDSRPPRLLIYVPLAQAASQQALVEFEAAGVVVRPSIQPPEQNSALAVVARQALQQIFPPAAVAEMVAQVESGRLTLTELDRQTEKGVEGQAGLINALFDTGNANEVALRFLAEPGLDSRIEERQALGGIATLMAGALGVSFNAADGVAVLRAQLARHILLTDLLVALGADTPPALQTISLAERDVARQTAVTLAGAWRNRLDLNQSYVHWADKIQAEIGLTSMTIPLAALARSQTFAAAEVMLQTAVEEALRQTPSAKLVTLAQQRLAGFWASQEPAIKLRWQIISNAGQVLAEAARVEAALKGKQWTAEALLARYAFGDERSQPWCLLDSAQRHLERDYHRFDVDYRRHDSLVQLVASARQQYAAAAGELAEQFTRSYEAQQFHLPQLLLQADLYHEVVRPLAQVEKVAYILVDAFRFEMARELTAVMGDEWPAQLSLALATPPTITEVGMAALLPGAERGVSLTIAGSKLVPVINGQLLKNRSERITFFRQALADKEVVVTKLDQLAPLANNRLAQQLKEAGLILVTASEEVDGLCENNPALARRLLDDVFNQLRRGLKALFDQGVTTAIITADHGYLFGEEMSAGDVIDAPGGQKAVLKRRVWIGKGGAHIPGTLRRPLSAFGIQSDLELVTPYNLACFKAAGGSLSYFHGGLSIPELAIPVLTVKAGERPTSDAGTSINWNLSLGSKRITTRFVTVTVAGDTGELLPLQPPAVRLELRAGNQPVSVPVGATYGFQEATKDVQLRTRPDSDRAILPNTITLQITEEVTAANLTVHLLDAATGRSLNRLENVPVNIAF
jgi:hypothetical protein